MLHLATHGRAEEEFPSSPDIGGACRQLANLLGLLAAQIKATIGLADAFAA
jgi:hypothetical protein